MKNELIERQNEFVEMFSELGSWQARFQYLIDLGSELPDMPEHLRTSGNRIEGCMSRTYFYPSVLDGIVHVEGWSNAAIPSGLIALIRELFDGVAIDELRKTRITFQQESELIDHLTGQRVSLFMEMIRKVQQLISCIQ
jgi:cysteine desulfuration protein SufE